MVAKPLCPLYKNIIKPLDRARYPELRYNIVLSLQQKRTKEQHGYTYNKSLNNHINITFKFKESPLSFTEST